MASLTQSSSGGKEVPSHLVRLSLTLYSPISTISVISTISTTQYWINCNWIAVLALILALARSLKLHLNLKMAHRQCLLSLKSAREDGQMPAQKTSRHARRGRNTARLTLLRSRLERNERWFIPTI